MPHKDLEQRRKYHRDFYNQQKEARVQLLSQFSCFCCGDPDDTVIQWHHVEPENKSKGLWENMSENNWWNEVLKCIPVCANCHLKIHKNKLCLIPQKLR